MGVFIFHWLYNKTAYYGGGGPQTIGTPKIKRIT
jgi:hypothetical protein